MIDPAFILNSSVLVIFFTRRPGTKATEREDSEVDVYGRRKTRSRARLCPHHARGHQVVNGVAALFVPTTLARRLGVDPEANPAALYALRLFGFRTVLIGAQLLLRDSGVRAHSLRVAPVIHALDATAALIAGERGQLPQRAATTAAIISTVNTVLAVIAQNRDAEDRGQARKAPWYVRLGGREYAPTPRKS
jgi:hypothetical protein